MLISVIVPTFNREHLIGRTIRSIIDQTYPSIEIIIVDDGSTDNTQEVVEHLAKYSGRPINYHKKSNGGCASARNKGAELANGDLIAFLDSDDCWMPTALETLVFVLIESNADFVYSPAIEVYENGSEKVNYPVAPRQPELFPIEHFKNSNLRNGAMLLKKKVFFKVGGMDESLKYNEDSDFVQRVAIQFNAAYSNVPTVRIYHHPGNKSSNRVEIHKALLKSTRKILVDNPDFALSLGKIAENRILEIKSDLIEALIMNSDFSEALSIASMLDSRYDIGIRLSLLFRSAIPLKAIGIFFMIKARVKRMFRGKRE